MSYLFWVRRGVKPAGTHQERVRLRLSILHFWVISENDMVEQAEEAFMAACLHLEGHAGRAGSHGDGDFVLMEMCDQLLHTWSLKWKYGLLEQRRSGRRPKGHNRWRPIGFTLQVGNCHVIRSAPWPVLYYPEHWTDEDGFLRGATLLCSARMCMDYTLPYTRHRLPLLFFSAVKFMLGEQKVKWASSGVPAQIAAKGHSGCSSSEALCIMRAALSKVS